MHVVLVSGYVCLSAWASVLSITAPKKKKASEHKDNHSLFHMYVCVCMCAVYGTILIRIPFLPHKNWLEYLSVQYFNMDKLSDFDLACCARCRSFIRGHCMNHLDFKCVSKSVVS